MRVYVGSLIFHEYLYAYVGPLIFQEQEQEQETEQEQEQEHEAEFSGRSLNSVSIN